MSILIPQNQLSNYIRKIKDLEVSRYEQELLHQKLNNELYQAKNNLSKLSAIKYQAPMSPDKHPIRSFIIALVLVVIVGTLLGGLAGFLLKYIASFIKWVYWIVSASWIYGKNKPLPATILFVQWGAVIGFSLCGLFMLFAFPTRKKAKQEQKAYKELQQQYEDNLANLSNCIQQQNLYIHTLENLIEQSHKTQNNTINTLNAYYSANVIYPKYQGIVPICEICEYFESGRCDSLTGPGGAYNLYESELRMNRILFKLDDIISRLDEICENQRMLAHEIRRSNSEVQEMIATLQQSAGNIEQNLEITAFYSKTAAMSTDYLAWMDFLRS